MTQSDSFQYDVFLSHSAKDKAVVCPLAERLRKDGVKVWFDEWVLKPGDSIPAKIEEGLERSRVLVLCMSANAFGSDWAQLESGTFRFRDPLNRERRFLPLRLDDAPIKGSLAQFLYIDWHALDSKHGYTKLLEACRSPVKKSEITTKHGWLLNTVSLEVKIVISSIRITRAGFIPRAPRDHNTVYAFSTDGKRSISCGMDGRLRLWDLNSGTCVRVFRQGKNAQHIEWSTDESRALLWSEDGKVRLVDIIHDSLLANYNKTVITKRQMDCFRLLANGCSSEEIQRRLGLRGRLKNTIFLNFNLY